MIELHSGNSNDKIVVTLTELQTLPDPHYLFVFEHVTTKEVVAFVVGVEESPYDYRYNEFTVNTASVFSNKPSGFWGYTVYEQVSATNTDPANAYPNPLEYGKMKLYKPTEFAYDKYNEPVTYKSYNG